MAHFAFLAAAAAFLALWVGQATAQTAEQDIEARRDRIAPRPAPLSDVTIQFTSQRPPSNAAEIRFQLADFAITGATVFEEAALAAVYADRTGREVSLAEVYEVAGAIQGLYREADYIFTRVIVPAQEISEGIVQLEVIEARIDRAVVEEPDGAVGSVKALVEEMVAPLIGAENPTGAMLERTLVLVNEIPGVTRATAVPQVGEAGRGSLDLFVNVERDPFEGVIYGDNRQIPGVGRGIVGASVTANSYSEAGDTTTLSYFNSFGYLSDGFGGDDGPGDFDERNTVQIEHSRYITPDGLKLNGRVLFSRTRPGDDLASIGIQGDQFVVEAGVSHPLYRTREVSLTGAIGVELQNTETDVSNGAFRVADDKLRIIKAELEGLARDRFGYTAFDLTIRKGVDILNASEPGPTAVLSRNDGEGDFTLVRGSVERLVQINEELSAWVRFGGQYAFDPLLASEEFAIGGLTFGRGFDPSEFTGDDGIGVQGELRYALPLSIQDFLVNVELYAFGDYGLIFNKEPGQPGQEDIVSAGGGMRLFLPEDYVLGVELGFPVDQPLQRTSSDDARLFLNFSKRL